MGVIKQVGLADDSPIGVPLIGYHNLATSTNVASTTAADGYPITNVANPATHLKWVGGVNTGDEYIMISSLSATTNYVAVARHNWGSEQIPVSVEVDDGGGFVEVIPATILSNDDPIIFRLVGSSDFENFFDGGIFDPNIFQTSLGADTSRSIRIKLAVTDSGIPPEAAVIYAGNLLVLERSIKIGANHVPITYGRRTKLINGMSESGNFLGRIMTGEWRQSKAEFEWFTGEFYRSDIDAFLEAAMEQPFFWAWSPEEYQAEVGYVWLTNDAEPEVDPTTRRIALILEMRGVA